MKLYRVDTPQPCDIEDCDNNAVLIVRTNEGTDHAVCPTHVLSMSVMNSENAEFFAVNCTGYEKAGSPTCEPASQRLTIKQ